MARSTTEMIRAAVIKDVIGDLSPGYSSGQYEAIFSAELANRFLQEANL